MSMEKFRSITIENLGRIALAKLQQSCKSVYHDRKQEALRLLYKSP